jgi:hypothetical protein
MGAVLAMMGIWKQGVPGRAGRKVRGRGFAVLGAVLLASCGSSSEQPLSVMLRGVATKAASLAGKGPASAPQPAALTPEAVAAMKDPLLLAGVPKVDGAGVLTVSRDGGDWRDWRAEDGVGLTFYRDVLAGTQGLGADLLIADVMQVVAALARGDGTARRDHRYLDGRNHEVRMEFNCVYKMDKTETIEIMGKSHATRRVREACGPANDPDGGTTFRNTYWIGRGDGVIWQSRQWIGPDMGEIVLQRLVR